MKKYIFLLALLGVTSLTAIFFYFFQPVASYHLEPRLDGNEYAKIYASFKEKNNSHTVKFPFHSRILMPFLASLMPVDNVAEAFQLVNFIFMLLTVASLFFLWQKIQLPHILQVTGFLWLLLHWSGLIRLNTFDPVTIDVPVYFFETLILYVLITQNYIHLIWLAPVATLCKELFPAFLVVLLAATLWQKYILKKETQPVIVIVIALIISILVKELTNYYFSPAASSSALATIWRWTLITFNHPFRIIRWVVGLFMAYGFWLIPVVREKIYKRNDIVLLLSVTCLVLSFFGGGDFTRLAFLGFPFIMTILLQSLTKISIYEIAGVFLLSLPFMQLFYPIPDPGTRWQDFAGWYPEYASPQIVAFWGLYIGVVSVGLFIYFRRKYSSEL